MTASTGPSIKLLAIIEAVRVTGPARNLIEFCCQARGRDRASFAGSCVEASIATFRRIRGRSSFPANWDGSLPSRPSSPFVAIASDAGITVDVLDERFRFDPRVLFDLQRTIERRAPDVLQTHNVKSHFLVRLLAAKRTRPWVAFHHGYTTTDLKMRAYNQLDRWSLRSAERVVTVSQAFAHDLVRDGVPPERVVVLHNAIDVNWPASIRPEAAHAVRRELGILPDERVVLAVGRLSQEKGHADLVTALPLLKRAGPGLKPKLVVVGEGPEERRIRQLAVALETADQVIFTGPVNGVGPYYRMADVLVLPSHSEGSPNVLLEGMAAGVPVVATAVGGVPEIVRPDESALLVRPHDPRGLADAIRRLLTDADLARRLATNARARIVERHSPESRVRCLIEMYIDLASSAARPIGGSKPRRRTAGPVPGSERGSGREA
jgi:glycosyltransferase involved in cell wall biosynthesis